MPDLGSIPTLGVGLNYKTALGHDILQNLDQINFIEIITERCFDKISDKNLNLVLQKLPVVFHGLSLSLGTSVAINKDSEANIFKEARYGIVGDWEKILPALTEAVQELVG